MDFQVRSKFPNDSPGLIRGGLGAGAPHRFRMGTCRLGLSRLTTMSCFLFPLRPTSETRRLHRGFEVA